MKGKHWLFAVLLLLFIVFNLDAVETRLMLGAEPFDLPDITLLLLELTISTSPLWEVFQQEFRGY